MKNRKVLSVDLSSKTGYALLEILPDDSILRIESGTLKKTNLNPDLLYPENYLMWAIDTWVQIRRTIEKFNPDFISVEETTIKMTGSNNFSQKFLEWTHKYLAEYLTQEFKGQYSYFKTDQWRVIVGCNTMTAEDKLKNKMVRDYKKSGSKFAYDSDGKRISLVNKKKLNLRKANEVFGLNLIMKEIDEADALCLGLAYCFVLTKKIVK